MLSPFCIGVSSVFIYPGTYFSVGNEEYTVNEIMNFGQIVISDDYIIFNETGFFVSSVNDIIITIVFINDDITNAIDGEKVIEFYADTNSGSVTFIISGFPVGNNYTIDRSGSTFANTTSNSQGNISFSNSAWSSHLFQIFMSGTASTDYFPPEFSNVDVINSDPLDTDSPFGWINISCDVTDNIEVDDVFINITNPDGLFNNVTMNSVFSENYFYNSSTDFSYYGNYSCFIWASDTSGNSNSSDNYMISMPPNWDVDMNGKCKVFDLTLISNNYANTGNLGWIREDIDNNGDIQVLDFVYAANHYNESWWQ